MGKEGGKEWRTKGSIGEAWTQGSLSTNLTNTTDTRNNPSFLLLPTHCPALVLCLSLAYPVAFSFPLLWPIPATLSLPSPPLPPLPSPLPSVLL